MAEVSSFAGACLLLAAVYGGILVTEAHIGWSNVVPAEFIGALYAEVGS